MQIISQTAHTLQLAEFRDHCRIPWTDDDPALQRALDAAVLLWESTTNWYTRNTVVRFDAFANMCLPGGPDIELVEVQRVEDGADVEDVTASWFIRKQYGAFKLQAMRSGAHTYNPNSDYRADVRYLGTLPASVKFGVYDWAHVLFRDRTGVEHTAAQKMPLSLQSIIAGYQRGVM